MVMIDIDPYHGGLDSLAALETGYGPLPVTLTDLSGREDGGTHLFFRRPPGKLTDRRLGSGIDVKTSTGYVVLPPSIHPSTGKPYRRIEGPVAAPPDWLIGLLRSEPPAPTLRTSQQDRSVRRQYFGGSIADNFCASTTWSEILEPHGWTCLDRDVDTDGARWRHPSATAAQSATIRYGDLFVYSPNTPFEVTESGNPHGYTKFRAYAVLNHDGDLSAAARALGKEVE
jgi:hypothetical protein